MPKYCGVCGQPTELCTCAKYRPGGLAGSDRSADDDHRGTIRTSSVGLRGEVRRFNDIALSQDETVVRTYHIGRIGFLGRGEAYVVITNKRVILRSSASILVTHGNLQQEVAVESVNGMESYYGRGIKWPYLLIGLILIIAGLFTVYAAYSGLNAYTYYSSGMRALVVMPIVLALALMVLPGVILCIKSYQPSYFFRILAANSEGSAVSTAANMAGMWHNSHGGGLVFTFKPTEASINMMTEIGACVMDIKARGDYATELWRA